LFSHTYSFSKVCAVIVDFVPGWAFNGSVDWRWLHYLLVISPKPRYRTDDFLNDRLDGSSILFLGVYRSFAGSAKDELTS
jgi:hypothetical protein